MNDAQRLREMGNALGSFGRRGWEEPNDFQWVTLGSAENENSAMSWNDVTVMCARLTRK